MHSHHHHHDHPHGCAPWHAMAHGGPGYGRWRRRKRHGGPGGGGYRIGKMLGDGELKLIVLALLEDSPRHGYDVIRALEERSSGVYSPSPGVVYPTLTFLEEAGYATAAAEGTRKVYTITDDGRAHLSPTIIDDRFILRLAILNRRTSFDHVDQTIDIIEKTLIG